MANGKHVDRSAVLVKVNLGNDYSLGSDYSSQSRK